MDALFHASDASIRAILTALCADDRVRAKALEYLDMIEPEAKIRAKAAEVGGSNIKKRKLASTLSICVQCDEPFYDGDAERCKYHSGEMEPDYDGDYWADHDENCHGTIDTDVMRESHPDGFEWTCCQKLGSEPGCQTGRHQSNPERSKKGKYESESEDPETSDQSEDDEDKEEEEDEEEDEEDEE